MTQETAKTLEMRIITRALQDESFKQQLLSGSDPAKAAIEEELGKKLHQDLEVKVLEETPNTSYFILRTMPSTEGEISAEDKIKHAAPPLEVKVTTRALQDESFKQQLLSGSDQAKVALEEEIGKKLPQDLEVKVLEETANTSYIVLPKMPSMEEEMSEEELETVAGGLFWTTVGFATVLFSS